MTAHKKNSRSLCRRLIYFVVMLVTGGAGVGGWAFKDHSRFQALIGMVTGKAEESGADEADLRSKLTSAVAGVLQDDPRQPGLYKVKITEIQLDPKLFKTGHTVDIQARVLKLDGQGSETVVWESKTYGENLAVAGKDELTAAFVKRPFEIDWSPGDKVVVEVWDRRSILFERRELKMALPEPGVFPLASGTHALGVSGRSGSELDSELNRIVLQSQRVGDSQARRGDSRTDDPKQVAERPIVIK
ncbi:MAG TPA: hypothetical protein VKF17_01995 [Isosphaeraceae bacterium]|nr:hypothetical protein [Isosphaeraceae bacterium]